MRFFACKEKTFETFFALSNIYIYNCNHWEYKMSLKDEIAVILNEAAKQIIEAVMHSSVAEIMEVTDELEEENESEENENETSSGEETTEVNEKGENVVKKRGRGRPLGSKNKPKISINKLARLLAELNKDADGDKDKDLAKLLAELNKDK